MTPVPLLDQKDRKARLERLERIYPIQADTSGWEDFRKYFRIDARKKPVHRFASVTHYGDFHYIHADFENRCLAKQQAMKHMLDDVYPETPLVVVDLDAWRFWFPSGEWEHRDPLRPHLAHLGYIYVIKWHERDPLP